MTRKQAKEDCGYTPTPTLRVCKNCASFAVDRVLPEWILKLNETLCDKDKYKVEDHGSEKNARCVTGGFPVKKMGSCNNWKVGVTCAKTTQMIIQKKASDGTL